MHLFLLLLFPLSLAFWVFGRKAGQKAAFFNAFLGIVLAAVFCAFKYFFSPYYFLTPDSFWENFLHIFIGQILLPLAALTAFFLIVYRKDRALERFEGVFPFYAGFYAVYVPFRAMSQALPHPAFYLFAKPILYLLMLLVLAERERVLLVPAERALLSKKDALLSWISLAINVVMPAAIEALWLLGMRPPLTILFVLLCAASAFLCLAGRVARKQSL